MLGIRELMFPVRIDDGITNRFPD